MVKGKNSAITAFVSSNEENVKEEIFQPELKTRRVQLLLKKSDYEKLKNCAFENRCSINHVVEELIQSL